MSVLMRFEDTYGMFKMYKDLVVEGNLYNKDGYLFYRERELYLENGLNCSKVLLLTEGMIRKYKSLGINTVVFVFDMDSSTSNSEILSTEEVKCSIERNKKLLNKISYDVSLLYIPTVYMAETIALYQYYKGDIPLTDLVNVNNTKELHTNILKVATKIEFTTNLKKFEFIDKIKLKGNLEKWVTLDSLNKSSISLLLGILYPLDNITVLEFMNKLQKHFYELRDSNTNQTVIIHKGCKLDTTGGLYKKQLKDLGYDFIK